ncbi:rRNA maturation RNase YbeY [Vagococcus bubulae]|uniref:Endoribonuclease YbeY n=1 Tax=Vagococcus bubulae TaxID=1977868 RepID=A0A429ZRK8_9ENTE|nr:rRNA maturation RNase YbeY [Vagococcus bubulae]RST96352.1 rRNA maturation RNase YbeY [Vagococcus bubulae]
MDLVLVDKTDSLSKEQLEMVSSIIDFAAKNEEIKLPENTEMSVTFVNDEEIHQINKEHRQKDRPTDVISFALEEEDLSGFDFDLEELGLPRNIGDLFISVDRTKDQAAEFNHSFDRELGFLTIHGFLHLNGYDHMTPEDEKEMFDLQRKILNDYGLER